MEVHITYFVHGTTIDNEQKIATGQEPGELSDLGKQQSTELRDIIKMDFDVVFCSDLKRSIESAEITFGDSGIPITQDKRLRECDYGELTGKSSKEVYPLDLDSIDKQFPGGESYRDVENRIRSFLKYLLKKYPGKKIAIVAHRAPQLALEVIINNKTWEQSIKEDWRMKQPKGWKPGWDYTFKL